MVWVIKKEQINENTKQEVFIAVIKEMYFFMILCSGTEKNRPK